MERLTKRNAHGIAERTSIGPVMGKDVLERLAAYEDSGLTPERCRELGEAEREGRVWILPEGWSVGMIDTIMSLAQRVRAERILHDPDNDQPIITWQPYNMLASQSCREAESALAEKGEPHEEV